MKSVSTYTVTTRDPESGRSFTVGLAKTIDAPEWTPMMVGVYGRLRGRGGEWARIGKSKRIGSAGDAAHEITLDFLPVEGRFELLVNGRNRASSKMFDVDLQAAPISGLLVFQLKSR